MEVVECQGDIWLKTSAERAVIHRLWKTMWKVGAGLWKIINGSKGFDENGKKWSKNGVWKSTEWVQPEPNKRGRCICNIPLLYALFKNHKVTIGDMAFYVRKILGVTGKNNGILVAVLQKWLMAQKMPSHIRFCSLRSCPKSRQM